MDNSIASLAIPTRVSAGPSCSEQSQMNGRETKAEFLCTNEEWSSYSVVSSALELD